MTLSQSIVTMDKFKSIVFSFFKIVEFMIKLLLCLGFIVCFGVSAVVFWNGLKSFKLFSNPRLFQTLLIVPLRFSIQYSLGQIPCERACCLIRFFILTILIFVIFFLFNQFDRVMIVMPAHVAAYVLITLTLFVPTVLKLEGGTNLLNELFCKKMYTMEKSNLVHPIIFHLFTYLGFFVIESEFFSSKSKWVYGALLLCVLQVTSDTIFRIYELFLTKKKTLTSRNLNDFRFYFDFVACVTFKAVVMACIRFGSLMISKNCFGDSHHATFAMIRITVTSFNVNFGFDYLFLRKGWKKCRNAKWFRNWYFIFMASANDFCIIILTVYTWFLIACHCLDFDLLRVFPEHVLSSSLLMGKILSLDSTTSIDAKIVDYLHDPTEKEDKDSDFKLIRLADLKVSQMKYSQRSS